MSRFARIWANTARRNYGPQGHSSSRQFGHKLPTGCKSWFPLEDRLLIEVINRRLGANPVTNSCCFQQQLGRNRRLGANPDFWIEARRWRLLSLKGSILEWPALFAKSSPFKGPALGRNCSKRAGHSALCQGQTFQRACPWQKLHAAAWSKPWRGNHPHLRPLRFFREIMVTCTIYLLKSLPCKKCSFFPIAAKIVKQNFAQ